MCLQNAEQPDSVPGEDFAELFKLLALRFTAEERVGFVNGLLQLVLQGVSPRLLIPFVFHDLDEAVISKATLDYSVLREPNEAWGPFTGPRLMLHTVETNPQAPDFRNAAVLAGVVLLGDRRLLPYLHGCWKWLGEEGRDYLARATSDGVITAGLVEFFLAWLEETAAERDFGGILGTLCGMPAISPDGKIHDIERAFPVRQGTPPLRLLQSWSFPEYLEHIRPRLERILEREAEPKLTSSLFVYWGNGT
jgi:hypothetical protein